MADRGLARLPKDCRQKEETKVKNTLTASPCLDSREGPPGWSQLVGKGVEHGTNLAACYTLPVGTSRTGRHNRIELSFPV